MTKTSTFTIHHDRCKPATWTPANVLLLAKFVETGDLRYAAGLSKLGVQLVLSQHHAPAGGTLEHIGWVHGEVDPVSIEGTSELCDIADDDDITPVCKLYRGPTEYVVRYAIDDGHGEFGGHEYEIKTTEAEANAFWDDLQSTQTAEATA